MPMLRDGRPRRDRRPGPSPAPSPARQVELLQTFADQAVIAIENVRLFTELEARNRDLTEALEQQTATAEILRVISSSPTDVQPVFDAIVRNAASVCGADDAIALRVDGTSSCTSRAHHGRHSARRSVTASFLTGRTVAGRAVSDGARVHVDDVHTSPRVPDRDETSPAGWDCGPALTVPAAPRGTAIGAIQSAAATRGRSRDRQIALLQTFADQAVIAIENVRLFTELQASNRELTDGARHADRHQRHPARHQPVADGCAAGVRRDRGQRRPLAAGRTRAR